MNFPHLDSISRTTGCFLVLGALLGCSGEAPEDEAVDTDGPSSGPTGTTTSAGTPSSTSAGTSSTAASAGPSGVTTTSGQSAVTTGGFGSGNATTTGATTSTTGADGGVGGASTSGGPSTTSGTGGATTGASTSDTTGTPTGDPTGTTTSTTGSGGTGNPGCDATGFYVEGTSVYDANCNEFVMRGVNVPHAWFSSNTQGALNDAASVGANVVRVVLATGGQWSRTSGSTLSQIIGWAKENKLVAMLEVHDSTGFGESAAAVHPDDAVAYWTSSEVLGAITGQEAYVMINIANEPFGNTESAQWSSFHQGAVQALRAAGLKHLFVVDAPNWGQDWEETMRNDKNSAATNVFNADPDRNVLFSVHMYDVYGSANTVTSYIDTFLGHGLPLIVGEFAADHGAGKNVDEGTIMSKAEQSRIGYIGWSWSGNGGDLGSLDITNNFNVSSLTAWGTTLVNGPSGIAETAQTCSCFE